MGNGLVLRINVFFLVMILFLNFTNIVSASQGDVDIGISIDMEVVDSGDNGNQQNPDNSTNVQDNDEDKRDNDDNRKDRTNKNNYTPLQETSNVVKDEEEIKGEQIIYLKNAFVKQASKREEGEKTDSKIAGVLLLTASTVFLVIVLLLVLFEMIFVEKK